MLAEIDPLIVEHRIEDEEFQFRPEESRIRDAGFLHVFFGLAGDGARVARIFFFGDRIAHIADHREGRVGHERIDFAGAGDGEQQHVRFIDRLPPADGGAVKSEAMLKTVDGEFADRQRGVLPQAGEIHEAQIDELDLFFFAELQHVLRGHHGCLLVKSAVSFRHLIARVEWGKRPSVHGGGGSPGSFMPLSAWVCLAVEVDAVCGETGRSQRSGCFQRESRRLAT